jgi:hypothetical protein
MVIDGRTQILKLTAGAGGSDHASWLASDVRLRSLSRLRHPMGDIFPASGAVDLSKCFITPPFGKRQDAGLSYRGVRMPGRFVDQINIEHVCH